MKFYAVISKSADENSLRDEYQKAREIGAVRLGSENLFFRAGLKKYYIPYAKVSRCYRRVYLVPAKMCCGRGDLQVENLVLCAEDKEVAQIPLPGTKAARLLMEELRGRMPQAAFGSEAKTPDQEEAGA